MPAIRCCLASYLCLIAAAASAHAGAIFPDGAKPEQLWNKGTFTEGVAVLPDGKIYFSDISRGDDPGRILRFDPASGETSVYCADSGQSNGLMFDATGRLLAACGANNGRRALVEIRNDGSVHELANRFRERRLNSPNDLVIHPRGWVYLSDPRYVGPEPVELDLMNVYRYNPASGELTRATAEISKPNGVIVSPDGQTLYVAETNNGTDFGKHKGEVRMALHALPIHDDGTLGEPRQLATFSERRGGIDGMTVDAAGHIYGAFRDTERFGILVFDEQGQEVDFLPTPELSTNCCFGRGDDQSTLYMTVGTGLYRVQTTAKGHHSVTP